MSFSVCDPDHGISYDPVAFFIALQHYFGYFVFAEAFILGVKNGVVEIRVEFLAGLSELLDPELFQDGVEFCKCHRHALAQLAFVGVLHCQFKAVSDGKHLFENVRAGIAVDSVALLCGALSEIVVLCEHSCVFIVKLGKR